MKKIGVWGWVGIIAGIAVLAGLFLWLKNKNGKGNISFTPETRTNTIYYPVAVPVNPHKPTCPPNTSNMRCNVKPVGGCVASYSTPDGKTWTLDTSKSNGLCFYNASAPAPTPAV